MNPSAAVLQTPQHPDLPITMKAIIINTYGSSDDLEFKDIPKPALDDNRVLVRVCAASLNPMDYKMLDGHPLLRLIGGLRKPRSNRVGSDVAGHVEAVGRNVTQFQPGDEVFGGGRGAFAEYTHHLEASLVHKPTTLTFEQAAALPVAGLSALQGLRDKGKIQPDQRVLINGAAGGVGTFAVQIAKAYGAHVTGVCSTRNVTMVRSLGADQVIDYTREDFTQGEQRYDLILDCVGTRSLLQCRRALAAKGTLVMIGASPKRMVHALLRVLQGVVLSQFSGQKMIPFLAQHKQDDLLVLKELVEAGKIIPVIDRTYPLSSTAEAMRYLEAGHARGKVVISIKA